MNNIEINNEYKKALLNDLDDIDSINEYSIKRKIDDDNEEEQEEKRFGLYR